MRHFRTAASAALIAMMPIAGALADPAEELAAAIQQWQDLFNAGDAAKAAETIFAEDGRLLPPDSPMIEGREAIAAFWQPVMDSPAHDLVLELVSADMLGDTAIETGTWSITVPTDDGGETQVGGKTLVVWKKGDDGQWRMSQDMWNDGS